MCPDGIIVGEQQLHQDDDLAGRRCSLEHKLKAIENIAIGTS